jgi:hypothetical protein
MPYRFCAMFVALFLCGCVIPGNSYKWDVGFTGTISGLVVRGKRADSDILYVGIHRHLSGKDAVEVHLMDGWHRERLIIFCTIEQSGQRLHASSESQAMDAWLTSWTTSSRDDDFLKLPPGNRANDPSTFKLVGSIDLEPVLVNGNQWEVKSMHVSLRTERPIPTDVFLDSDDSAKSGEEHIVAIEGTFNGRWVRTNHVSI